MIVIEEGVDPTRMVEENDDFGHLIRMPRFHDNLAFSIKHEPIKRIDMWREQVHALVTKLSDEIAIIYRWIVDKDDAGLDEFFAFSGERATSSSLTTIVIDHEA